MTADEQFENLIQKIENSGHSMNLDRLRSAYNMAKTAHNGQKRRDGSEYITHCISAADICVDFGLDEESVVAALLHDTIEDTDITKETLAKTFGPTVAELVEGVTKLTRVQFTSVEDEQMENLRKMLLAMAKDIRVILIKIADRLHNMRTMDYQTPEKQRLKSHETMEIYAPIAHRLGMAMAKWELEDLSLRYLDPEGYQEITKELEGRMPDLEAFLAENEKKIKENLDAHGIDATIYSRVKHIYSIYRKMYTQKLTLNGIFDLCAFRIIVNTIPDCYNVLGIIHEMFNPVPGRFKDYVSTPKPNMYQSVHTTVIGDEGIPFEVQIRTWEMHYTAEYGVAAHWKYKLAGLGETAKEGDEESFAWIRKLLESQQESDSQDFLHNLKIDLFADEVFVFTPKGKVVNLPAGATPIDFAYMIHSDVGNSMTGAKVNGKMVSLGSILQNGDIVEIKTSKSSPGPSRDWLNIAKSGSARTKIKQWFKKERREENVIRGRQMLEDELKTNGLTLEDVTTDELMTPILKRLSLYSVEDLYAAIGYGGVAGVRIANRLSEEYKNADTGHKTALDKINQAAERRVNSEARSKKAIHGILVEGIDNCLVKFSRCCSPVPGDDIIGFTTRGQGISVHRTECVNYLKAQEDNSDDGRWVRVSWANDINDSYTTTLILSARDRNGLVMDLATVLNSLNAKVKTLNARDIGGGRALITVTLDVKSLQDLNYIKGRLAGIPGVSNVSRNGDKTIL